MGYADRRADRLNVEALLEFLEPVPQAFSACENDRHDRDVHVVDQVRREELADCRWSSANSDVSNSRRSRTHGPYGQPRRPRRRPHLPRSLSPTPRHPNETMRRRLASGPISRRWTPPGPEREGAERPDPRRGPGRAATVTLISHRALRHRSAVIELDGRSRALSRPGENDASLRHEGRARTGYPPRPWSTTA